MYLWRSGGIRNRGTKQLIGSSPRSIWWDENDQLIRYRLRDRGSNPNGNTAYNYYGAIELEELLQFLEHLANKLPKLRKYRRLLRKYAYPLSKILAYVLEHKD